MKVYIRDKYKEIVIFIIIYAALFTNAIVTQDSIIALISAFCGITYTILAGKGLPVCYPIGLTGSGFYVYLSFINNLWGNMFLYLLYYIPMQITGYFSWNKNLKNNKYEIKKTCLSKKEQIYLLITTLFISAITAYILFITGDAHPIADSLTTVFSILGMYLTVRRAIEQWFIWGFVNAVSLIMWLTVAINGGKVYSTTFMWFVYFILAFYFYKKWSDDLKND